MISTLAISGYRSIRELSLSLDRLNVITGPNGSGKSNLYRALRLLVSIAHGELHAALAREGGFPSVLWAGPEQYARSVKSKQHPVQGTVRRNPVALKLGFSTTEYSYAIELGLPKPSRSAFGRDPEIKRELLWSGKEPRPRSIIADRKGPSVMASDKDGEMASIVTDLALFDSMMTHAVEPRRTPEMLAVRETMRTWRFYDHFAIDESAPARQARVGTYSPVLSADGGNLAAAVQTIREIGDAAALDDAINDAFPGTDLQVQVNEGYFELVLTQTGLLRPLRTQELSDGTLRFLLLTAALLSPRPPELLVLNEPESSLHADLVPALARLIVQASVHSQIVVVTHARHLIDAISNETDVHFIELHKELGESKVAGNGSAPWKWPTRR